MSTSLSPDRSTVKSERAAAGKTSRSFTVKERTSEASNDLAGRKGGMASGGMTDEAEPEPKSRGVSDINIRASLKHRAPDAFPDEPMKLLVSKQVRKNY